MHPGTVSNLVTLDCQNGAKQGKLFSLTLFKMYIDNILIQLKHSGYECHGDVHVRFII